MHSLNDLLLVKAKGSRDALQVALARLQELGRIRQERLNSQASISRELDSYRATDESERTELAAISSQIDNHKAELQKLEARRTQLQESQAVASERFQHARRMRKEADETLQLIERDVRDNTATKVAVEEQIARDTVDAFHEFLRLSHDACDVLTKEAHRLRAASEQLQAFEVARHTDMAVGSLWEEYEECSRLLQAAAVPAVQAMLKDRRDAIRSGLLQQFPGAFAEPSRVAAPDNVMQIYWMRDPTGRRVLMFLPISPELWGLGPDGEPSEAAVFVVWAVTDILVAAGHKPELRRLGKWTALSVDATDEAASTLEQTGRTYRDQVELNLQFSQLPDAVSAALGKCHEIQ